MSKVEMAQIQNLEKTKLKAADMQKQLYQFNIEIEEKKKENIILSEKLQHAIDLHNELKNQIQTLKDSQLIGLPEDIEDKLQKEAKELDKPKDILVQMKEQRKSFQTHLNDYNKALLNAQQQNSNLKVQFKVKDKENTERMAKYNTLVQITKDIQKAQKDLDIYRETIETYKIVGETMTLETIQTRMKDSTQNLENIVTLHKNLFQEVKDMYFNSKYSKLEYKRINYFQLFLEQQLQIEQEEHHQEQQTNCEGKCMECPPVTVDCACG